MQRIQVGFSKIYGGNPPERLRQETLRKNAVLMIKEIVKGNDVYVQITDKSNKRYGSIAKVVPTSRINSIATEENFRGTKYLRYGSYNNYVESFVNGASYTFESQFSLGFTGRKQIDYFGKNVEIEWLKGYSGPTNYCYDASIKQIKTSTKEPIIDIFGVEPKEGDLITLSHTNELWVGTVSKLNSDKSVVYVALVNKATKQKRNSRIQSSEKFMIIDENLKDRILISKLTN